MHGTEMVFEIATRHTMTIMAVMSWKPSEFSEGARNVNSQA